MRWPRARHERPRSRPRRPKAPPAGRCWGRPRQSLAADPACPPFDRRGAGIPL